MSAKIEIEWFLTSEKAHPDAREDDPKESIPCLVDRRHMGLEMLCWNPYHNVWDGADGDDFECQVDEVVSWAVIPEIPVKGSHR